MLLDILDTTFYTTILDASARRAHPKQCTRGKSFDHMVRDCLFLAREVARGGRTIHRHPRPLAPSSPVALHPTPGKTRSGFQLQGRKDATFTNVNCVTSETPANAHAYAKLVRGNTPRPITRALPGNRPGVITRRYGVHVCGHTRTLISYLIYYMTLSMAYVLDINVLTVLLKYTTVSYPQHSTLCPWQER